MKNMKLGLLVAVVIVLSLITFVEFGYSQSSLLPWVRFNGTYSVTAGVGVGALTLNATVKEADYKDGTVWLANVANFESIIGAKVELSGATRTGDYSFNGDPNNPDDVRFSIIAQDGFIYFDANLSDGEFVPGTSGILRYVWMNPLLDPNDPDTLNLYNISLATDASHPSRYINELAYYLAAQSVSGMKMQLRVPSNTAFTTNVSNFPIMYGLIDGLQSLNTPPVANAGDNIAIEGVAIDTTMVYGIATDSDGDTLKCRWIWVEDGVETVLLDWTPVGSSGECNLDLSTVYFSQVGTYTLTLEVNDEQEISSDEMILTIENSAPNAAPGGAGTYEVNSNVTLSGQVSDFDGDLLSYQWVEGADVLFSGTVQPPAGGFAVDLPADIISTLVLGVHTITLQVDDGINSPVSSDITVTIIDSMDPTLAPEASDLLLWPPNHVMVDIHINANANDNSGTVTLSASVASNEPENGLGDGDMYPDWTQVEISQITGDINLQVRRERSGNGDGRKYIVTVTATDVSGNSSSADVEIRVPHDMRNRNK